MKKSAAGKANGLGCSGLTERGWPRLKPICRLPLIRQGLRSAALALEKGAVRVYQWTLSPFIGHQCRFYPSCSEYALAALDGHGPLKGAWLALRRLLRCHPFHPGGVDLPPPAPANAP